MPRQRIPSRENNLHCTIMQEPSDDAPSEMSTTSHPKSPFNNYFGLLEAETVTALLYPPTRYAVLPAVPEDSAGSALTWDDMALTIMPVS